MNKLDGWCEGWHKILKNLGANGLMDVIEYEMHLRVHDTWVFGDI